MAPATNGFADPRARATAAWAQLAWFTLVVTLWSGALATLRIDPDYTSGELLDHLGSWLSGQPLYAPLGATPPFRVLNYPPLVLVLARGLTMLGVPGLAAGRIVNGLGLLVLVAAVAWWLRARGVRGGTLAGSVGLLGASFPVIYAAGQFHIELWAAAGTVWGFALLDRARFRGAPTVAGVALATACFAKQTQAFPALVALSWVWSRRREHAPAATVAFGLGGAVGAAAITGAWGAEAWRQMVGYTVGTFSALNLGAQALAHLLPWLVLMVLALRKARAEGRGIWDDAAWWYWLGALVWSLSAARRGSGYPYFLDIHLATVIWAGPEVFTRGGRRRGGGPWWGPLLVAQVVLADAGVGAAVAVNVTRLEQVEASLPDLCASMRGRDAVLVEEPGLARACGHPALLDPFITTSLARRGIWDPRPFEGTIGKKGLDLAVLPFDPRTPPKGVHAERWTAAALRAFANAPTVLAEPAGVWLVRW